MIFFIVIKIHLNPPKFYYSLIYIFVRTTLKAYKELKMTLADVLLKKDINMTLVQAKEAEQALLRYFEILYQIKNGDKNNDRKNNNYKTDNTTAATD